MGKGKPVAARPDFTGTWKLSLEKSTLRGAARRQLLMKIESPGTDADPGDFLHRRHGFGTAADVHG